MGRVHRGESLGGENETAGDIRYRGCVCVHIPLTFDYDQLKMFATTIDTSVALGVYYLIIKKFLAGTLNKCSSDCAVLRLCVFKLILT